MELADELPSSTKFDAFDTAPGQYPPRAWLPGNISLYVQDAFKSFPTDFHGIYDIVHIALFILVVPDNDPSVLISNLLKLLSVLIPSFLYSMLMFSWSGLAHDSL